VRDDDPEGAGHGASACMGFEVRGSTFRVWRVAFGVWRRRAE
jgi:hypothetical protein